MKQERTPQNHVNSQEGVPFLKGYLVASVFILVLFSVVAVISALGTYRISIDGSKNLLEARAVDVAVNIGFTLERLGLREELFPALVNSSKWNDLAFLALYDREGTIVLHSNPHLVGRSQVDPYIRRVFAEERPVTHFATLATGEDVFVLDFPLQLHTLKEGGGRAEAEPGAEASEEALETYCLRVSFHPYPAQSIVRRANFQLVVVGLILSVLWMLTFFFLWLWRRNYRLELRLRHQARMAALGEMAAVLAHEIRNPLSSIKGFAQFHLEGSAPQTLQEDLSIIVEEARRLERLTEDLLAYARPLRFHVGACDLAKLCRDIRKALGEAAQRLPVHIVCQEGEVLVDREKLLQIVLNLLRNAIEAAGERPDGEAWLRVAAQGDGLVVVVEDNGGGIAAEVRGRLLEPFVTTKAQGTGLGLAIVFRLVEAMHGTIGFTDREGGGTRVEVHLPSGDLVGAAGSGEAR